MCVIEPGVEVIFGKLNFTASELDVIFSHYLFFLAILKGEV